MPAFEREREHDESVRASAECLLLRECLMMSLCCCFFCVRVRVRASAAREQEERESDESVSRLCCFWMGGECDDDERVSSESMGMRV